jgi:hypothetical protein
MNSVTNDARQILVRVLLAQKDNQPEGFDRLGCNLINIVLDALGAPKDSTCRWNREQFFEQWEKTAADEKSIETFLDWVADELDPQLN